MNTYETACSWVRSGFSVLPIGFRSKRPAFDALRWTGCTVDADGGPQPAWEMFKYRAPTDEELRLLFAGPRRNLGVVTGYNGLVVLDFDERGAYDAWISWAKIEGGTASRISASTYRVYSARGVHVYVIIDEPVESYKVAGVDIKAQWGYVLAPPSVHPCGHQYTSTGTVIARCARLADVFPFGRPVQPDRPHIEATMSDDPWEAATRAVECGGEGAVSAAKMRLAVADLLHVVREDRGGAWALCPLHRDTNPSLRVYADGHYHCFGCQAHGDVIDLYAALHQITNREAIAALAGRG